MLKKIGTKAVCCLLILGMLVSCAPQNLYGPGHPSEKEMMTESARMIDSSYEMVRSILLEEGEYSEDEFLSYGKLDGEVVMRSLKELDRGEEMMEFLYNSDKFENVDAVLNAASAILDEREMATLKVKAEEVESQLMDVGEKVSRSLNATQKVEFYKDLRSLVVKSVVLLTAAIVYAFVPRVLFWGKIAAATAVSIAAGVVASTLITIVEWADKDTKLDDNSFTDWLTSVTVDPFADWALAQGIINTQSALTESPITAALILGVFAIYSVTDSCKILLQKYNFRV